MSIFTNLSLHELLVLGGKRQFPDHFQNCTKPKCMTPTLELCSWRNEIARYTNGDGFQLVLDLIPRASGCVILTAYNSITPCSNRYEVVHRDEADYITSTVVDMIFHLSTVM